MTPKSDVRQIRRAVLIHMRVDRVPLARVAGKIKVQTPTLRKFLQGEALGMRVADHIASKLRGYLVANRIEWIDY